MLGTVIDIVFLNYAAGPQVKPVITIFAKALRKVPKMSLSAVWPRPLWGAAARHGKAPLQKPPAHDTRPRPAPEGLLLGRVVRDR